MVISTGSWREPLSHVIWVPLAPIARSIVHVYLGSTARKNRQAYGYKTQWTVNCAANGLVYRESCAFHENGSERRSI
jgi:hypothetical protein